jgi:hypothetical protein
MVDDNDILVELISHGTKNNSFVITNYSIFENVVAFLKFTIVTVFKRDADKVLIELKKELISKNKEDELKKLQEFEKVL